MTFENGRMVAYEGQGSPVYKGINEQGKHLFVFSQSKLKQMNVCPERGRREFLGIMPSYATDSNAMGRAVHTAIECCLTDMIEGRGPWHLADMITVAIEDFDEEMALPSSRWVKAKTPGPCHDQLARMIPTWYAQVLPKLKPVAVEVNFGPTTVHENDEMVIQVRGQIDYIDEDYVGDWKTSGRRWEPWEHQRWDVQPTLYLPMAAALGYERPTWRWHVLLADGGYQMISTERTEVDWLWLQTRLVNAAKLLLADLPTWPQNDTHALCSPKWCGAWDECKGASGTPAWAK